MYHLPTEVSYWRPLRHFENYFLEERRTVTNRRTCSAINSWFLLFSGRFGKNTGREMRRNRCGRDFEGIWTNSKNDKQRGGRYCTINFQNQLNWTVEQRESAKDIVKESIGWYSCDMFCSKLNFNINKYMHPCLYLNPYLIYTRRLHLQPYNWIHLFLSRTSIELGMCRYGNTYAIVQLVSIISR